jgi:hypothetical protein
MSVYGIWVIIWSTVAIWVSRDARKRYPMGSKKPALWAICVLILGIFGLIAYMIARPKKIS